METQIIELINELKKNTTQLQNCGFDMSNIIYELNNLDKKSDQVINYSNSHQIDTLYDIKTQLDYLKIKIDEFLKSAMIFINIDKLSQHLNYNITETKMEKINLIIVNDLSYYLSQRNIRKSSKENELIRKLYEHIKFEYRYHYHSFVFDRLLNMKFGLNEIYNLLEEDIKKYLNQSDIYKRYNEYINLNDIDKTMLFLISFNEDNYKDSILSELDIKKEEIENIKSKYKEYLELKNKKPLREQTDKKKLKDNLRLLCLNAIPKILAVAILLSINISIHKESKSERIYKTTYETYDDINGIGTYTNYNRISMDDIIIELYYPNEENEYGKLHVYDSKTDSSKTYNSLRTCNTFIIENDGRSIEEYYNLDLDNIAFTSEIVSNDEVNSLSLDTYKRVLIPTQIDTTDYEQDYKIGTHIKASLMYIALDMVASLLLANIKGLQDSGGGLFALLVVFKYFKRDMETYLKNIKEAIDDLNVKENNIKYDKNKLKELKKEYIKTKKEYELLIKKYENVSTLLKYNDYSLKLKI
ncbi:MAG: hypothetical protein IKR57_01370 [Bacilli bacterium]|nr:hypothetical protein [Bacilli bacterium]